MQCDVCGCTDDSACVRGGVTCFWVEPQLCSMCASVGDLVNSPAGYAWLLMLLASIAMVELDEQCEGDPEVASIGMMEDMPPRQTARRVRA